MSNTLYRYIEGENENKDDIFSELQAIQDEESEETLDESLDNIEIPDESTEIDPLQELPETPEAPEANISSELEAIQNGTYEPDDYQPIEAPVETDTEATAFDRVKDTGVDIAKSAVMLGESFVGLTKMAAPITRLGFDAVGYDAEVTGKFLSDLYSDERKEEEAEVEDATGVVGTIKALIQNPAVTIGQGVQMAPGMLSIMGAARVMLARSSAKAISVAMANGIKDPKILSKIGRKAGEKAATITAAAAEGVQQTGTSFNQLVDNAESIGKAYTAAILSGLGTAGFAFLGGKLGRKLGLGDVEAGIKGKGGAVRKVVGGAIQEGILEETPQSMQEQAWNNYAMDRPILEGVPEAGATGFVLGSVMGGGMTAATEIAEKLTKEKEDVFDELEVIAEGKQPEKKPSKDQIDITPNKDIFKKIKEDYSAGNMKDADIEAIKSSVLGKPGSEEIIKTLDNILSEGKKLQETATPQGEEAEAVVSAIETVGSRVFGESFEPGKVKIAPETDETKSLRKVAENLKFGNINFFDPGESQLDTINGFYDKITKQIYLNAKAERPLLIVMAHESLHKLKAEDPKLYAGLKPILQGKALGFEEYINNLNRTRIKAGLPLADRNKASEEFIADFVGTLFPKASFWNKLNKQDPALTRKLADVLTELIKKIRKALTGRDAKKYFKDLDAIETEIAKVYAKYAQTSDRRWIETKFEGKEKRVSQRRADEVKRKKIGEMTEEEKGIALRYHELTGLLSKRAYNESEKKAVQVSIDVDALKWVNDTFGHIEGGDELLKTVAKALSQSGIDAYHISGDEFYLQADNMVEAGQAVKTAVEYLENNPLTLEYPDGTKTKYKAGFSYGAGKDITEAEEGLKKHKSERKLSKRGEKPTRGLEEGPEGKQVEDGERGPGEKVVPPDNDQLIKVALDNNIKYTKKVKIGKRTVTASKNAGEALSEVSEKHEIIKRILGCV